MMPMSLVTRFRIKPEPHHDPRYYQVMVFRNKPTLYKFWELVCQRWGLDCASRGEPNFEAITHGFSGVHIAEDGTETPDPCVGLILFHEDRFGAGIVAHELTHAALFWYADRRKLPLAALDTDGEPLCLVTGELNHQFWKKWLARETRRARTIATS